MCVCTRVCDKHITVGCDSDCGEPLFLTPSTATNSSYKEYNSNLWFMFVPAIRNDMKDVPLLVTTQGGPGAPMTFEIYNYIGSFTLKSNNENEGILYLKKYNNNAGESGIYS